MCKPAGPPGPLIIWVSAFMEFIYQVKRGGPLLAVPSTQVLVAQGMMVYIMEAREVVLPAEPGHLPAIARITACQWVPIAAAVTAAVWILDARARMALPERRCGAVE